MRKKQLKRLYENAERRNTLLCGERDNWRRGYQEAVEARDSLKAEIKRLTADLNAATSQRDAWKIRYDLQVELADEAEGYLGMVRDITHAWVEGTPVTVVHENVVAT